MAYGIYLHVPFCVKRCAYCDFTSSCDFSRGDAYFRRLKEEICASPYIGRADSVYFGGGTPSAVEAAYLVGTLDVLRGKFDAAGAEITVECNPESLTEEKLCAYLSAGVNRISLGVQSLDDDCLAAAGRVHDAARAKSALKLLQSYNINFSCDVMTGLPYGNVEKTERTVSEILRAGARHLSCYSLTVEKGTALAARGYAPDEDRSADEYDAALRLARQAGLERYEVSNFALPGYESRHNGKYWRREPYLGFGAAAHSFDGKYRFRNGSVADYLACCPPQYEEVSERDARFEKIFLTLRTREGLCVSEFDAEFHCDFFKRYAEPLAKHARNLVREGDRVRLAEEAFYVMNDILSDFAE